MNETPRPKTPRGKCPRCGKRIAVRSNGKLRRHTSGKPTPPFYERACPGSGTRPVEGSVR